MYRIVLRNRGERKRGDKSLNMKELAFRGQRFILSLDDNILHFHIEEPFYSAGKQFGWSGASIGLGINAEALAYAVGIRCQIQVTVGKNKNAYLIKAKTWQNFTKNHNAFMIRGETNLHVVQWSKKLFKTVPKDEVDKKLEMIHA